jgi:hypothetical protein
VESSEPTRQSFRLLLLMLLLFGTSKKSRRRRRCRRVGSEDSAHPTKATKDASNACQWSHISYCAAPGPAAPPAPVRAVLACVPVREPEAATAQVRFDERGVETGHGGLLGHWQTKGPVNTQGHT